MGFSLNQVVSAMSSATKNSTLNWDVVVNYTAEEMNKLLEAAHSKGGPGQLERLQFTSQSVDPEGHPFEIKFDLYCGAPIIQFTETGPMPTCSVQIPIIKGTAGTAQKPIPVSPNAYRVLVSNIELKTANGTVGVPRNPQDADKPFHFPPDKVTTGVVTLSLGSTPNNIAVDIKLLDKSKEHVWFKPAFLREQIKTVLSDSVVGGSIVWDLGHINNQTSTFDFDNSLVPKSFSFATYADDKNSTSILSLFIQTDNNRHGIGGKQLQTDWLHQWWTTYQVSPIPEGYTASVIFNNDMLLDLMTKSSGMTFSRSSNPRTFTVKTGKTFHVQEEHHSTGYVHTYHNAIDIKLDDQGKELRMAFNQSNDSVPIIELNWDFKAWMKWGSRYYQDTSWQEGTATITNRLHKQQNMDSGTLPQYEVHVDVGISARDWDKPKIENDETSAWTRFWSTFKPGIVSDALPSALPTAKFKLLDFKFFMVTNLLLPGSKVINFDSNPGFRFPKDLFVVGHVVKH